MAFLVMCGQVAGLFRGHREARAGGGEGEWPGGPGQGSKEQASAQPLRRSQWLPQQTRA